jgi:hypothetical protein
MNAHTQYASRAIIPSVSCIFESEAHLRIVRLQQQQIKEFENRTSTGKV